MEEPGLEFLLPDDVGAGVLQLAQQQRQTQMNAVDLPGGHAPGAACFNAAPRTMAARSPAPSFRQPSSGAFSNSPTRDLSSGMRGARCRKADAGEGPLLAVMKIFP